jgi:hypothetical protein
MLANYLLLFSFLKKPCLEAYNPSQFYYGENISFSLKTDPQSKLYGHLVTVVVKTVDISDTKVKLHHSTRHLNPVYQCVNKVIQYDCSPTGGRLMSVSPV